jgi:hypothetical protein
MEILLSNSPYCRGFTGVTLQEVGGLSPLQITGGVVCALDVSLLTIHCPLILLFLIHVLLLVMLSPNPLVLPLPPPPLPQGNLLNYESPKAQNEYIILVCWLNTFIVIGLVFVDPSKNFW